MFLAGMTVPMGARIGAVVGTWYTLVNQGDVIIRGEFPWVRIVLNYMTPFCVASVGFLAGRRRSSIERLAALLDTPDVKDQTTASASRLP